MNLQKLYRPLTGLAVALALTLTTSVGSVMAAILAPTLTTPTTSNVQTNQITLNLKSSAAGTGYFTLLNGTGTACGTGAQVKLGQTSGSVTAPRHGSLPLIAATTAVYTLRNLPQSTASTVCFTADDGTNLQTTPVKVNVTTTTATAIALPVWSTVGSAGFSAGGAYYTSLSFAPDGAPYVAFQDADNSSKATVMKYTGSAWAPVGSAGFSASVVNYTSLSFAPDGTPYVAYRDEGNSNKATVMKYTGSAWSPVPVGSTGFSDINASFTSLSFAPDGTPYVVYSDFVSSKAIVMKYTGSTWSLVPVGSTGFSTGTATWTSLSFAPDGTPYVAYKDYSNSSKATVMKYTGSAWAPVGSVGFSAGIAQYISLSFAPDGTPYVAYQDAGYSNKATVMKLIGSTWTLVGSAGLSVGAATYTSLSFAPDGAPYVAYTDYGNNGKATVMKLSAGTTTAVTSNLNPATVGASITFTGAVTPAAATGTVTFKADGSVLGTGVLASGAATYNTTALTVGYHSITAVYGGDSAYLGSTATAITQTVNKAAQTITFTNPGAQTFGTTPTLTATATSALAPTFTSATTGVCTITTGGLLTFVTTGSCTIIADQSGNGSYNAAPPVQQSFTVSLVTPTASITNSPVTYNGSVQTATVACQGGGAATLASGGTGTNAGSYPATVNCAANGNYAAANGLNAGSFVISPALTTPTTSTVGTNQITLNLTSSATGTGYFTLLNGTGTACGTGAQVKAGQTSGSVTAPHFGSLPLIAATTAAYTLRNLPQSTASTVCFTADDGTNLQATPVTANVTTTTTTAIATPVWSTVGSAGFSAGAATYTSLSFAPDGAPYVAYQDVSSSKAFVMKYTGSAWTPIPVGSIGFSANSNSYTSLSFAPDSTPYVAYLDIYNRPTVMKYTGAAWAQVGSASFTQAAAYTSLSFAPDGTPYVAFQNYLDGNATVIKYTGAAWALVGSAGFSGAAAYYTSLSFAPDGTPYVAYRDGGKSNKATVMKYTGSGSTGWTLVGSAGFSAGIAQYTSLSFAPDGAPYVAYKDYSNSSKATVMKYTEGAWSLVGSAGFSAGIASYTSLSFAPDGAPYVAYQDGNSSKATVMKYTEGAWTLVGSAGFSAGQADYTSLSFAPDGAPYVACRDGGNSNKATVMKLSPGTATSVTSNLNPATVGASITFTGTVTPAAATGTVTFKADESFLGTGVLAGGAATYTTTALTVGNHSITAVYRGDGVYLGSTATAITQTVIKADQTITFTNPGAQTFGTTPTLTATASSALAPTFTSATTGVCTITTGGLLTFVTTGSCTINANQSGNGSYNAAPQVQQSFTVRATPTASITNSPVTYNGSAQTATVACQGGGTATLASGGTGTSAGSYPATVDCAASTNYAAATGLNAGSFVINKATMTLSVTNSPVTYNGSAQTALVAAPVPGSVANVRYDGSLTKPSTAGSYAVSADFTPVDTTSYTSLTAATAGTFVITKAMPTLTVTNSPVTFNNNPHSAAVIGSVSGIVNNILTGGAATQTAIGSYTVTADFTPTDTTNYTTLTAAAAGNFSIVAPASVSVTLQTVPAGLGVSVDGGAVQTAPYTFSATPGSSHTIATTSPQGSGGTRYVFAVWSDSPALSHGITAPNSGSATYTATFTTEYLLTTAVSPAGSGVVIPAAATWYAAGASPSIGAVANSGSAFSSWSGPAANYTSAATTVTMTGPTTLTATFKSVTTTLSAAIGAGSGATGGIRTWPVTLSNTGGAAAPGAQLTWMTVSSNGTCKPVVTSSFPVALGNIATGGSAVGSLTVDFSSCAAPKQKTIKFNVSVGYSAGNGAVTGSTSLTGVGQ